jgi:hypothetical protein
MDSAERHQKSALHRHGSTQEHGYARRGGFDQHDVGLWAGSETVPWMGCAPTLPGESAWVYAAPSLIHSWP